MGYYIKETDALAGYDVDETKHYFLFHAGDDAASCDICAALKAEYEGEGLTVTVLSRDYGKQIYGGDLTPDPITNRKTPESYTPKVTKVIVDGDGKEIDLRGFTGKIPTFHFYLTKKDSFDPQGSAYPVGADGVIMPDETGTHVEITGFNVTNQPYATKDFGSIQFTKPGTFTFSISEDTNYPETGWNYDSNGEWTLTLEIKERDDTGALYLYSISYKRTEVQADGTKREVEKKGQNEDGQDNRLYAYATFTNMYSPAPGELPFLIKKIVSGAGANTALPKTFTFQLTNAKKKGADDSFTDVTDGSVKLTVGMTEKSLPADITVEVKNDGTLTGTSENCKLSFTEPGDYQLTLSEVVDSNDPNWTSKTPTKTLNVTVGPDVKDGKYVVRLDRKEVDVSGLLQTFEYENQYNGTTSLSVKKVWMQNGEVVKAPTDAHVTVTLQRRTLPDGEFADVLGDEYSVQLPQNDNDWSYKWDNLPKYDASGKAYEYSVKESGAPAGWVFAVDDTAADDREDAGAETQKTITNTFTPATFEPKVQKIVTGNPAAWPAGGFSFTITAEEGAPNPGQLSVNIADAAANATPASFGGITFNAPGTYTYKIKETAPSTIPDGWKYDTNDHTLVIKVDTAENGALTVTNVTLDGNPVDNATTTVTVSITNTWNTPEAYAAPSISKAVTGKDATAGTFTFDITLKKYNNADVALPNADIGVTPQTKEVQIQTSGTNTTLWTSTGEEFKFTKSGTYTFEITERAPGGNFGHDDAVWIWTVEVTNDADGNLQETWTMQKKGTEGAAVPEGTAAFINPYHAKTKVTVTKSWNGGTNRPSITVQLLQGGVPYDPDLTSEAIDATVTLNGDNNWTATWDNLPKYDESKPDAPAFEYDVKELNIPEPYTMTKSSDTDTGADFAYNITNTYAPAKFAPQVTKKWTGSNLPAGWSESFTFTLSGGTNSTGGAKAALPANPNITIDIPGTNGAIGTTGVTQSFGNIEFTAPGTYTFYVDENCNAPGWVKDSQKTFTVTVDKDPDTGELYISKVNDTQYAKDDAPLTAAAVTFNNTYNPGAGEFEPKVQKQINGVGLNELTGSQTVNFKMTLTSGEATNVKLGNDAWPATGVTKDVVVAADTWTKTESLGMLSFSKPGEYVFEITESMPYANSADWTANVKKYTLKVTVAETLTDDGKFTVTAQYTTDDSATAASTWTPVTDSFLFDFVNTYNPLTDVEVQKTWIENGYTNATKPEITVTLCEQDSAGNVTPVSPAKTETLTESNNWYAKWENLPKYDASGKITYTVTEAAANGGSLGAWKGKVTQTAPDDSEKYEIQLENSYEPTPGKSTPNVEKELTGELPEGLTPITKEFKFKLTPDAGVTADAVASGDIVMEDNPDEAWITAKYLDGVGNAYETSTLEWFDEITFKKQGNYSFTIEEEVGTEGNVTYDKTKWTYRVSVTEKDGKLTAVGSYWKPDEDGELVEVDAAAAAKFINNYIPTPATYQPKVAKIVRGETPSDKTFTFTLAKGDFNPIDGAEMPSEVTVTLPKTILEGESGNRWEDLFGEVKFTKAGTYTFTITETQGSEAGYTYDDATTSR